MFFDDINVLEQLEAQRQSEIENINELKLLLQQEAETDEQILARLKQAGNKHLNIVLKEDELNNVFTFGQLIKHALLIGCGFWTRNILKKNFHMRPSAK